MLDGAAGDIRHSSRGLEGTAGLVPAGTGDVAKGGADPGNGGGGTVGAAGAGIDMIDWFAIAGAASG